MTALIHLAASLICLRELAHRTVNGEDRGHVRLPRLPLYRFSHYEPPHNCYTGLPSLTATKSSDNGHGRPYLHTRSPAAHLIAEGPRDSHIVQFAHSSERDPPTPHRNAAAFPSKDLQPKGS